MGNTGRADRYICWRLVFLRGGFATMIKIFEEQFKGPLAELADHSFLIGEMATDFEPALQIFHPDRLDSILKSFGKRYEAPEPRAVASQWY